MTTVPLGTFIQYDNPAYHTLSHKGLLAIWLLAE